MIACKFNQVVVVLLLYGECFYVGMLYATTSWHGMHEVEAEWKSGRSLCLDFFEDFVPRSTESRLPRQLEIGIFRKIFRSRSVSLL